MQNTPDSVFYSPLYVRVSEYLFYAGKRNVFTAIAMAVIAKIEEFPYVKIEELASYCNTTPSSITKFVRELGYGSFQELKNDIAPYRLTHQGIKGMTEKEVIEEIYKYIPYEECRKMAEVINNSRSVIILSNSFLFNIANVMRESISSSNRKVYLVERSNNELIKTILRKVDCVFILTMFLLGPFGKYLGDYLASAIVYIIGVNSLVAGMIIGAAYSFIVLFGLHWAIIPVVFSNIAHGGDPIYAIGGMSAIAQMGVALGILIRTRDTGTRQLASSAFFPSLISGVTEPILYGLIIPNRRTIYYIIIAGAVGGGIVGGYNITINNLVFASLLSIPTASNMLIYSVGLFATLITGAVLPVIFGYKSRF
ncbi:TPA: PTS transporter subunit EIIC [Klebsiella pneumoniae]|uniref:PTS transporter subunit EIIC n=2 Tax=Klebsiella pneumoniae TaxID=573 RepID=UPI0015C63474|nr:PTS transporter subunit EIIC [Klebsiella pneumoniae]MDW1440395.1 PTS transporter subunit EIIC [Klebsiella pneumoniae]HBT0071692.1 PTS transporter subunit EIIC [Klebsiella pneumoniae]HBT0161662.1 PTS transporter subunit EIIC [Klebsiella pneumoniae]HBT0380459.1 PTS transporter subunit EIIC [Klebsiella pneumoniae]HBY8548528.1 PTS transporter subunit EIIC [Klebsiella pneumoniae]